MDTKGGISDTLCAFSLAANFEQLRLFLKITERSFTDQVELDEFPRYKK
jgi:hypothetical protein